MPLRKEAAIPPNAKKKKKTNLTNPNFGDVGQNIDFPSSNFSL